MLNTLSPMAAYQIRVMLESIVCTEETRGLSAAELLAMFKISLSQDSLAPGESESDASTWALSFEDVRTGDLLPGEAFRPQFDEPRQPGVLSGITAQTGTGRRRMFFGVAEGGDAVLNVRTVGMEIDGRDNTHSSSPQHFRDLRDSDRVDPEGNAVLWDHDFQIPIARVVAGLAGNRSELRRDRNLTGDLETNAGATSIVERATVYASAQINSTRLATGEVALLHTVRFRNVALGSDYSVNLLYFAEEAA